MMRTLSEARVPFEVPRGAERAERLRSVLEVLYLIVNEGYAATAGEDWLRPELCEDAMRLGRTLAALAPDEPEVLGLVALMQLQASRTRARTRPGGEPVLLLDQDRSRWDRILIARGSPRSIARTSSAVRSGRTRSRPRSRPATRGPGRRRTPTGSASRRSTTRSREMAPSPVVEINRGVALAMAFGPEVGLAVIDAVGDDPWLSSYHLLPAARGLRRAGGRAGRWGARGVPTD